MSTVAGNYFGGIVKDSLFLCLDAGKKDSYIRTGTAWTDISGNNKNGTLTNFASQTTWNLDNGGSVIFDGTNDYVDLGANTILLNNSVPKTFSFWVRISSLAAGRSLLSDMGGAGNRGWWAAVNTSGQVFFGGSNTGLDAALVYRTTTNANLVINTWYNIVITYNPTTPTALFYRNATLLTDDNSTIYSTYNSSTINVQIGAYLNGTAPLNGNIAQVLVYDKVLSQSEITQNYNALKIRFT